MTDFLATLPWASILWWSLLVGGLLGTALFSGMETGLYCLNPIRLTVRAAHGPGRLAARTIQRELRKPERMLGANLIANLVCGDLAATGASRLMADWGYSDVAIILVNAVVLTPVFFVLVESVPKELFRLDADRLTYRLAWVLPTTRLVFTAIPALPVVHLLMELLGKVFGVRGEANLESTARERVASLIKDTAGTGFLSESQAGLVDRALAFADLTVADEMVPWSDVAAIAEDATLGQLREALERRGGVYVPLVETRSRGSVVGVVWHGDAYLKPGVPVRQMMVEPARLAPRTPLAEAIGLLRRAAAPVGVVEEAGRAVGIVTMDDLVEPLVAGPA